MEEEKGMGAPHNQYDSKFCVTSFFFCVTSFLCYFVFCVTFVFFRPLMQANLLGRQKGFF